MSGSTARERSDRFHIRVSPKQKAMIARAAALSNKDMTDFILEKIVPEAQAVIEAAQADRVSGRDFARIMELLDNPPRPNARLRAAIASLPDTL